MAKSISLASIKRRLKTDRESEEIEPEDKRRSAIEKAELTGIQLPRIAKMPVLGEDYEIFKSYAVGYGNLASVNIVRDPRELYFYYVDEPALDDPEVQKLYMLIMKKFIYSLTPPSDPRRLTDFIVEKLDEALDDLNMSLDQIQYSILTYYVLREFEWRELTPLFKDPYIEDITYVSAGGNKPVYVVLSGVIGVPQNYLPTNIFFDELSANSIVYFISQKIGKTISIATPMVEGRTPEGYRVEARLDEVGRSPAFTVRKFPEEMLTLTRLIKFRTLTPLMASYLWMMLEHKKFILVIGETGAGKTTILQALLSFIPIDSKIAIVEDTPEINIPHELADYLYTRHSVEKDKNIELFDLVKRALRIRPAYIVVGEARGAEMNDIVQASATGHGSLSTFHASDPFTVFQRITHPPINVGESFATSIAIMLKQAKIYRPDKGYVRRIVKIWETLPEFMEVGGDRVPKSVEVFTYRMVDDTHYPDNAGEVVKRSYHIKRIAEEIYAGFDIRTQLSCIAWQLAIRERFLQSIVSRGVFNVRQLTEEIMRAKRKLDEMIFSCPELKK